jgi:DNA invertase Pin-like site-specific DNA recombinase
LPGSQGVCALPASSVGDSEEVFAELERSIIQERVRAGLDRARAKGKTLGRPRTDANVEQRICDLAATGMVKCKIARTLGVGVSVAQRVLAAGTAT